MRKLREAIEDTNFDSRKEETKDKLFRAISKGPYMSQLRNAMKSVTEKTRETLELQGMEEKIRSTMEDNVILLSDMISNGNFWEEASPARW